MLIQFKTDDRSTINVRLVYGEKNQSEAERLTAEKWYLVLCKIQIGYV